MSTTVSPPAPPPTTATTAAGVRASDAEREDTVARLHHALGEGRLDLSENEIRVMAAYAAQYRHELSPLLSDLPSHSGSDAPTWTTVWESLVWRARTAVWGPDAPRPTTAHLRAAVLAVVVALAWFGIWALVGAAVVA